MGQYTPAVVVHDMHPPQPLPEWLRPLRNASSQDHRRLVVCSTHPQELVTIVDLELWQWARRQVLARVSVRKVAEASCVGSRAVARVLKALVEERDVYTRTRVYK